MLAHPDSALRDVNWRTTIDLLVSERGLEFMCLLGRRAPDGDRMTGRTVTIPRIVRTMAELGGVSGRLAIEEQASAVAGSEGVEELVEGVLLDPTRTLAAIAHRRRGRSTTYGWTLAMAFSAATVAANLAVAGTDHVAQAEHATPAVKMVLAWHLPSRFFEGSPAVIRSESAFLRRGVKPMLGDLSRAGHPDPRMAGAVLGSGRMSPRWPASQDAQRPAGRPGEDCRWV